MSAKTVFWLAVVLGAFLLALILGTVLMLYAESLAHPDIAFPKANRQGFVRVAILIDGTQSVGTPNYVTIQEIVQEKIIPALGANDIAVAYDVQPWFSPTENKVFGLSRDQPPQDENREEILEILARNWGAKAVNDPMYDMLRKLALRQPQVEQIRQTWAQRVRERQQPKARGSDICGPLTDIGRFLSRGEPDAERWLFVLSDLRNESPAKSCPGEETFPETRIVLIYPFASDSARWTTVETFWQNLFGNQPLDRMTFAAALADGLLLPTNPLEGLVQQAPGTSWEYARPLLGRFVLAWLGATLLIALITASLVWRRRLSAPEAP